MNTGRENTRENAHTQVEHRAGGVRGRKQDGQNRTAGAQRNRPAAGQGLLAHAAGPTLGLGLTLGQYTKQNLGNVQLQVAIGLFFPFIRERRGDESGRRMPMC